MKFILGSKLVLKDLAPDDHEQIKQNLTMANPKFYEAQKMGRYTKGIPSRLTFYQQDNHDLVCPRGAGTGIYRFLKTRGADIEYTDERRSFPSLDFKFCGQLRPLQVAAVNSIIKRDFGLLEAGTGAGKTVMALYIIAQRRQPALVVVHTKELLSQWCERIEQYLSIAKEDVGQIGAGKFNIGEHITIAMVQTLYKKKQAVVPHIGHLIVDECHRCPSRTFTEAVTAFDCKYMLGLTATPWRRDKLSQVIFWHIGEVTGRIEKTDLVETGNLCEADVQWVQTRFHTLLDAGEYYSTVLSELTKDPLRNELICRTIAENKDSDGISLIISDRKDHCALIQEMLSQTYGIDAAVLTGSVSWKNREQIVSNLHGGACRYLIATGQLVGEGFDLPEISMVFLATPVKFSGRLIQYIGRALRPAPGKKRAVIFDFVDGLNPVFLASARTRHDTYLGQGIHASLIEPPL